MVIVERGQKSNLRNHGYTEVYFFCNGGFRLLFPPEYFGIGERCSIYAAIGFEAVLGVYLFNGFK